MFHRLHLSVFRCIYLGEAWQARHSWKSVAIWHRHQSGWERCLGLDVLPSDLFTKMENVFSRQAGECSLEVQLPTLTSKRYIIGTKNITLQKHCKARSVWRLKGQTQCLILPTYLEHQTKKLSSTALPRSNIVKHKVKFNHTCFVKSAGPDG